MNKLLLTIALIIAPSLTLAYTTISFCNDEGLTPYPNPSGWADYGICENDHLYMIVDIPQIKHGQKVGTKYKQVPVPNGNYLKSVTGLACNIAVYKCEVERY